MVNVTFLSLAINSLIAISPLYTISHNSQRELSYFCNSHFSRSISNIIYANTQFHSTTIHKNLFMLTLNSPLTFSSEDFCPSGTQCCLSKKINYKESDIISGKNISSSDFDGFDNKNSFFLSDVCGNLKITQCQFINCYSIKNYGGGIWVEQYCEVILHNCIFDNCHAVDHGGAGAIAKKIDVKKDGDRYSDVNHLLTKKLDIQYTCFQSCYLTGKPGFGAALIMGAEDVTFYFASTVDCPKYVEDNSNKAWGAQFDILANNSISSQFINATGGNSHYCGSMEYRGAKSGFFRYQTITKTKCKYATSFTSVSIDDLKITSCNIYQNTVTKAPHDVDNSSPPALVFVRIKDLKIENFYFKENDLGETGIFAAKEYDSTIKITLNNCYADISDSSKWVTDYVIVDDCHFEDKEVNTFPLRQLNLGRCQGEQEPGPMIISSFFTASSPFTHTLYFSETKQFSETGKFSNSLKFSQSYSFTNSKKFSNSDAFSVSSYFTNSDKFSNTLGFTKTTGFTQSNKFTKTGEFTQTGKFTKTGGFTQSNKFTKTGEFTQTNKFTKTYAFSGSSIFTGSDDFDRTSRFTPSSYFTPSDMFSQSSKFSQSDFFSRSSPFSNSKVFIQSSKFTKSNPFSDSKKFTSSIEFTLSDSSIFDQGVNVGSSNKGSNTTIIAASVAAAVAAAIIAAIIIFFVIKRRRRMNTSGIDLINETNNSITVDNALQTVMTEDDPFANDF